jgi:hypothetical protein
MSPQLEYPKHGYVTSASPHSAYRSARWSASQPTFAPGDIISTNTSSTISDITVNLRKQSAAVVSLISIENLRRGAPTFFVRALMQPDTLVISTEPVIDVPSWYNNIEVIIEDQVVYEPEEGFPTADATAMQAAANVVRAIFNEVGDNTPEPYFDVALDHGVDIYFDFLENELEVHIPPSGSANEYCFIRLNGTRSVERHPSMDRLVQILRKVVAVDGVPTE